MCVWGQGAQCSHFMELFLIPLGACVCACVCWLLFQLERPVVCCAEWHYGIRGGQVKQCVFSVAAQGERTSLSSACTLSLSLFM